MDEFNAIERDAGCGFRFETKHGACASFDTTVILLNVIVHIFAGANGNGFAILSEPVLCIRLQYSYSVGLASIDGAIQILLKDWLPK